MKNVKSIGVIGQGFVGGALTQGMIHSVDVYAYDKAKKLAPGAKSPISSNHSTDDSFAPSLEQFVRACESKEDFTRTYFLCLPTPMFNDGAADLSIVESVLTELASVSTDRPRIAVIKSTVPPGSTDAWNKRFNNSNVYIVFNPEFLTEANSVNDFKNQTRIILGGPRPWINSVKQIYQAAYPKVPIIKTSSTTAEMVKYFTNVQLAARVVLSCELAQVCSALDKIGMDIDYDKVVEYAKYDTRLGGTHMNVPGNDGVPGARGHCFPKDINALIVVAKQLGVAPTIMDAVWKKNLEIVPTKDRDWEKMVGRAVSECVHCDCEA